MIERAAPVLAVLCAVVGMWYLAAIGLNYSAATAAAGNGASAGAIVRAAWSLERPLLPAPHQVANSVLTGMFGEPLGSPRSLLYHAGVTAATAALGLALALVVGIGLAVAIVHVRVFDRSLMPWVIASQTIPVLAIAPMVVVVLGNIGLTGVLPKALIAGWLSFFPITTAMVTGLRAPDRMQLDLMRTYNASGGAVFAKVRWPASMGFLFAGIKVAATLAIVGAIVAELPTGAQAGLGARLLAGSYYGQTLQIWAALVTAALLTLLAVAVADGAQRILIASRGGRL
ncbi:MAG: ABC transporter permease subunit [Candidatus Velthaea sp.]|jgi:NitT/TauT family transport system permease protein